MVSFIYDDLGNHPTQDGTSGGGGGGGKGYFYDRQNMLTRVDDAQGGQVMRSAYDAFRGVSVMHRAAARGDAAARRVPGWKALKQARLMLGRGDVAPRVIARSTASYCGAGTRRAAARRAYDALRGV